jgi:Spy/CpxP family protein refolding chaperone
MNEEFFELLTPQQQAEYLRLLQQQDEQRNDR